MGLKGSGAEVGQLKQFECTYQNCQKRFDSVKQMKGHKLSAPEHDYCKKCDLDCDSWEDLTQHKVSLMSEWMHNRSQSKDESPKHITCEFCGEDFKSFGGRKKHRTQYHPADQSLECPAKEEGCSGLFTRASNMIAHLEQGQCHYITAYQFRVSVQHKHVQNEIGKNVDLFVANLGRNPAFAAINDNPGLVTDGSEVQDDEDGGVALGNLIDREDEAQKGGYEPMKPEVDLIGRRVPLTRNNLETWPRLRGQAPSRLNESMRSMSIGSGTMSIDGSVKEASDYASEITSRRGGNKVYTESYPSLNSPTHSASNYGDDHDDTASEATTTAASFVPNRTAWTTKQTSKALFKDAKPTPPLAGDWSAIAKHKEDEALASQGRNRNMLYARNYDPGSSDYNAEAFFHPVIAKYCCPFPICDDAPYDTPSEISSHLLHTHFRANYTCTTCFKRFTSATAMIGHMESSGRCRVKDSNNYKSVSFVYHYRIDGRLADILCSCSTRSAAAFSKLSGFMSRRSISRRLR